MAQVHYVIMADYDDEVVYAYLSANKGKINKLARDFEETEDEDGEARNRIIEQGSEKYKDGFMFVFNNGEMYCDAVTEEDFRDKADVYEYCAFFTGLKDLEINIPIEDAGYDEDLDFENADYYGDEPKLAVVDGYFEIGESVNTTFKYVPTFESFVNEKFKAMPDKRFPIMKSFRVGFRDGKGKKAVAAYQDNPEESLFLNKKTIKDYKAAVKIVDAFVKKAKIKAKPEYREPELDMPGMIDLTLGRDDYQDREAGKNLQPLYTQLSKLETSASYGSSSEISTELKKLAADDYDAYSDMMPASDKRALAKFYPHDPKYDRYR